ALASNTTVHFTVAVIAYLWGDLILDATAVLQGFYAVSVRSGEDILAQVRRLAAAVMVIVTLGAGAAMAQAQAATQLDNAIDETLRAPEYSWRTPDDKAEVPPFVQWIVDTVEWAGEGVSD